MAVTAFIGAGGKSTNYITNAIRSVRTIVGGFPIPIFERVAKKLDEYYVYKTCNFEEIFFVLELLETYYHAKHPFIKPQFKAPFAPFVNLEASINEIFFDYPNEPPHISNPAVFFSTAKSQIIFIVAKYVDHYDQNPLEEWFKNFWTEIVAAHRVDIATLNYDTVFSRFLVDCEDGFENTKDGYQIFNPKLLTGNKNTVINLHGSICFGYGKLPDGPYRYLTANREDLSKFSTSKEAISTWSVRIEHVSQSGDETVIGPIVTGLRKPDKLIAFPYSYYNYWFAKSILENNRLLIVGYSFSDLHYNTLLERVLTIHAEYKVVIIDFIDFSQYACDKSDSLESWPFDGSNSKLEIFAKFLRTPNPLETLIKYDIKNGEPVISEDGRTRIYFGGLKKTTELHGTAIIEFIKE